MRPVWLAVLLLAVSGPAAAVERVVSLAPSLSEIVVELGSADLLVGVLDAGERPAELKSLPSVGRYGQLDMEQLLSLKPDLLLLWPGSVGPAQREQLRRLNIPTYVAEPHNLEQLTAQIEAIASQLGRPERGVSLAEKLRQRLDSLRQLYRRDVPLGCFIRSGIGRCTPLAAGRSSAMRLKCAGRAMCLPTSRYRRRRSVLKRYCSAIPR